MERLSTTIDPTSPEFRANHERMTALVAQWRERTRAARLGGGEKYLQRHRQQGKLPVRERIDLLLDTGSPFLELSPSRRGACTTTTRRVPVWSPASAA